MRLGKFMNLLQTRSAWLHVGAVSMGLHSTHMCGCAQLIASHTVGAQETLARTFPPSRLEACLSSTRWCTCIY